MYRIVETNPRVRRAKRIAGLTNWQVADLLGIHENTFLVWMRHEMPEEKQNKIIAAIEAWEKENNQ